MNKLVVELKIGLLFLLLFLFTGELQAGLCGNGIVEVDDGEQCDAPTSPDVCTNQCKFNYCSLNKMDINQSGACTMSDFQCLVAVVLQNLSGQYGLYAQYYVSCKLADKPNLDIDCNGTIGSPDLSLYSGILLGKAVDIKLDGDQNGIIDKCEINCGDGILKGSEQCDDGNININDGCSPGCKIDIGYVCPLAGVPCTDIDFDNDGTPDDQDAYPLDPTQSSPSVEKEPEIFPPADDEEDKAEEVADAPSDASGAVDDTLNSDDISNEVADTANDDNDPSEATSDGASNEETQDDDPTQTTPTTDEENNNQDEQKDQQEDQDNQEDGNNNDPPEKDHKESGNSSGGGCSLVKVL